MISYQVPEGPDGVRVVLSGVVDLAARAQLRKVLARVVADSAGAIVVDLAGVTFLDCSGIGAIVTAHTEARRRGRVLTVSRPCGVVRQTLELSGAATILVRDHATAAPGPCR
jgi:anti-anti-sigma factor